MSLTTTDELFARRLGVLWRDTGLHVLALARTKDAEVVVLGGGSALLWRMLDEPVTLVDVLARLVSDGRGPSPDDVRSCLEDLVSRGLVERITVERVG